MVLDLFYLMYQKITNTKLLGHLFIKLVITILLLAYWLKHTIVPGYIGPSLYNFFGVIIVNLIFVYIIFSINALLPYKLKHIFQILISTAILFLAIYWFIKIPPYNNYPKGLPTPYNDVPYSGFRIHDTKNYVLTFMVQTFIIIYFSIEAFKQLKK